MILCRFNRNSKFLSIFPVPLRRRGISHLKDRPAINFQQYSRFYSSASFFLPTSRFSILRKLTLPLFLFLFPYLSLYLSIYLTKIRSIASLRNNSVQYKSIMQSSYFNRITCTGVANYMYYIFALPAQYITDNSGIDNTE